MPGGVGRGGSPWTRLSEGRAGSIVLLVLGEEEAGGVAEGVGRHQLGPPLVGEAVAALSPALGPLVVLHGRGAGGVVRGHPGARVGAGSGFGARTNRGRAPGGGGGGGGRSFGRHRRGRSCFSGRVELLIQRDVPDVDGQHQDDVWRPQTDLRGRGDGQEQWRKSECRPPDMNRDQALCDWTFMNISPTSCYRHHLILYSTA